MRSRSNAKELTFGLSQCRRLCHLTLSGLVTASGFAWAVPGNATGGFITPDISAPAPVPRLVAPPADRKSVLPPSSAANPPQKLAAPTVTRPAPVVTQPPQTPPGLQKNSYIDAPPQKTVTIPSTAPSSVVIKTRNSSCQTIVSGDHFQHGCGKTPGGSLKSTTADPASSRQQQAPPPIPPRRQRLASSSPSTAQRRSPLKPFSFHRSNKMAIGQSVGADQVFSLGPIAKRGIKIALAPLPEYTRATNRYAPPSNNTQFKGTDLFFPLASVNPITSAFGWRIHPISGQERMHEGTDIGAPLGTPVMAAYSGTVAAAQWSGGYGLMVTLRHLDGTQESRYAHLSEVFVESGQVVTQGEIIGRVGNTGFSTGPHLHFEWRHLTHQGWVAVDAGPHLQFALANLMRAQNGILASRIPHN